MRSVRLMSGRRRAKSTIVELDESTFDRFCQARSLAQSRDRAVTKAQAGDALGDAQAHAQILGGSGDSPQFERHKLQEHCDIGRSELSFM
jgi:hypothetical protein